MHKHVSVLIGIYCLLRLRLKLPRMLCWRAFAVIGRKNFIAAYEFCKTNKKNPEENTSFYCLCVIEKHLSNKDFVCANEGAGSERGLETYFENRMSSGFVNLSAKLCSDTADTSRDISPNP